MAGDPNWENVVLAMHMDGANGSTTFTDIKGHVVTRYGTPTISTLQSKFGGASAKFNGTIDYLSIAGVALGESAFTVECFVYFSTTGTQQCIISQFFGATQKWNIQIGADAKPTVFILGLTGGNTSITASTTTISPGSFVHFELSRDASNVFRFFVNGVLAGSVTRTGSMSSVPVDIGASYLTGVYASFLNGYVDDLKITQNAALHTANFTPSTTAFMDYAGQVAGTVKDDAGELCARTVRAYTRGDGELVGTTVSNATTGAFTINTQTLAEHTVIAFDDGAGSAYNALVFDKVTPA